MAKFLLVGILVVVVVLAISTAITVVAPYIAIVLVLGVAIWYIEKGDK